MVAAQAEKKTEMVAPGPMVKMRANRPCNDHTGHVRIQGEEFETTEEHARMLEQKIEGHYAFFGQRFLSDATKFQYQRAARV
jgi:hypothetical protein